MKTKHVAMLAAGAVVAGLAGHFVVSNIRKASDFDFEFKGFVPTQADLFSANPRISGRATMGILNKSDINAEIKDIDIQVFSQGARLGSIRQPALIGIPAKGTFNLTVEVSADPKSIADNWRTLLSTYISTKNIPMDFVGRLRVKTIVGFVTIPVRYSTSGKDLYDLYKKYY